MRPSYKSNELHFARQRDAKMKRKTPMNAVTVTVKMKVQANGSANPNDTIRTEQPAQNQKIYVTHVCSMFVFIAKMKHMRSVLFSSIQLSLERNTFVAMNIFMHFASTSEIPQVPFSKPVMIAMNSEFFMLLI